VRIVWTPEALQDREDIWDFIVSDNPKAAIRMDELFSNAVSRLTDFPLLGQTGKILGPRELIPHESYRIVYEIQQETLWILALIHTARHWPPIHD
jgi:addiction module RelE/StbE family toxin